jgi:glycosyltransferase involved in cell wall biosynthesis
VATEPRVSIIVPAYNEAATIADVLARLARLPLTQEVIVVDDGSDDATPELAAARAGVKVVKHGANRGKGAAVRTGIAHSTGDIVVIQDADMEYDPVDIPRLIEPITRGAADVTYGTRLRGGEPQRAHLFWHYAGNKLLSTCAGVLYNTTLSDIEVGYKAFKGDLIRAIPLVSSDFRIEPEITAKVLRRKARVYEIPISYYGRTFAEGKNITWRDGFKALQALARFRFGPY